MKPHFLKTTVAIGFAILTLNIHAEERAKGMDMGNMKMDCSRHMGDMKGMECTGNDAVKATSLTDGEVKNVDAAAGHVTLKHGAIENMKMPPMTMTFSVQDKAVLAGLKEGSKVKFAVKNIGGVPTITSLSSQK